MFVVGLLRCQLTESSNKWVEEGHDIFEKVGKVQPRVGIDTHIVRFSVLVDSFTMMPKHTNIPNEWRDVGQHISKKFYSNDKTKRLPWLEETEAMVLQDLRFMNSLQEMMKVPHDMATSAEIIDRVV